MTVISCQEQLLLVAVVRLGVQDWDILEPGLICLQGKGLVILRGDLIYLAQSL